MKCPVCGCKDWVLEQDPLSECGHGWDDIIKYIERLKKELSELRGFVSKSSLGYLLGDK